MRKKRQITLGNRRLERGASLPTNGDPAVLDHATYIDRAAYKAFGVLVLALPAKLRTGKNKKQKIKRRANCR